MTCVARVSRGSQGEAGRRGGSEVRVLQDAGVEGEAE